MALVDRKKVSGNKKFSTEWQIDKIFNDLFSGFDYKKWLDKYKESLDALVKQGRFLLQKEKLDLNDLDNIKQFIQSLEQFESLMESGGPGLYYIWLKFQINQNKEDVEEAYKKAEHLLIQLESKLTPIITRLSKLPLKLQEQLLLSDVELKEYNYWLKKLFNQGKHLFDPKTETILNKLYSPLYANWKRLTGQVLTKSTVRIDLRRIPFSIIKDKLPNVKPGRSGKCVRIPLTAVSNFLTLTEDKANYITYIDKQYFNVVKKYADFASIELNSISQANAALLKERGYQDYYEEIAEKDEITPKALRSVQEVITNNFDVSQDYYKWLSHVTKLDLHYGLRGISLSPKVVLGLLGERVGNVDAPNISYGIATSIMGKILQPLNTLAYKYFREKLNGFIDVYPRVGKSGGAFSISWSKKLPGFILLNWGNTLNDLSTLAHEFGHSLHSYLANKTQNALHNDYSLAIAEFASTFLETLVMYEFVENINSFKEELGWSEVQIKYVKLRWQIDFVKDAVSTIFRQLALFNFEMEFHNKVLNEGFVPLSEINKMFVNHMTGYLGNTVKFLPYHKFAWISWPHLRRPFYVYTYAFGLLAGLGLFRSYKTAQTIKEKKQVFEQYLTLLKQGSSKNVVEIFKLANINVESKEFWQAGIDQVKDILNLIKGLK